MKLKKNIEKLNFAYKCFFLTEGVVFLFEKITPFKDEEINVRIVNGEIFLEMGHNVALLTEKTKQQLLKSPNIFLGSCAFDEYEGKLESYCFEVDEKFLAKLEGIVDTLRALQKENKELVAAQEIRNPTQDI